MANKITSLEEKIAQLQRELREAKKGQDIRKKILLGTAVYKAIDANAVKPELVERLLDKFVSNKSDREFLGLPNPEQKNTAESDTPTTDRQQSDYQEDNHQPNYEHQNHY